MSPKKVQNTGDILRETCGQSASFVRKRDTFARAICVAAGPLPNMQHARWSYAWRLVAGLEVAIMNGHHSGFLSPNPKIKYMWVMWVIRFWAFQCLVWLIVCQKKVFQRDWAWGVEPVRKHIEANVFFSVCECLVIADWSWDVNNSSFLMILTCARCLGREVLSDTGRSIRFSDSLTR